MRAPPAVIIRCKAGTLWRALQAVCLGSAIAVVTFRLSLHDLALGGALTATNYLACGVAGLLAAMVVWRLSASKEVQLHWTGQAWHLNGRSLRSVQVRLDFGAWMLLQCVGAPRGQKWQTAREVVNPSQWSVWRATVYCAGNGIDPEFES